MRSFFDGLTPDQQQAALEYRGEENMMAYRASLKGRGAALNNATALASHSNHVAKSGMSKLSRIRELEAEVAKLTKERNALREALTELQNVAPPRSQESAASR